jgi:CHRD domain
MKKTLLAFVIGVAAMGGAYAQRSMQFDAHLQGFNLAGLPVATNATGEARVEVIDGGTALRFRVNVAGITNLWMAHIHIAPVPVQVTDPSGPVAFWFVGGPPQGTTVRETINGRLAEGFIITNADLVSWSATDPLNGTIEGLVKAIQEGRASVIVHTNDLNPATTALVAGDSPGGELRGTLR